MTMFMPSLLALRASEELASSALPGAPVGRGRPPEPLVRRWWRALGRVRRRQTDPPTPHEVVLQDAEWHVAAAACSEALWRWHSALPWERAVAYSGYRAALDREEAAARELACARRRKA